MRTDNPFAQAEQLYELSATVTHAEALALEAAYEENAYSISSFEQDAAAGLWRISILLDGMPAHLPTIAHTCLPLQPRDWVSDVQQSFPPLMIGEFAVLGTHHHNIPTHGKTVITLDAGAAFGTGEHPTTSGCLLALGHVMRTHRVQRALDMGCGSAILAMGAAKRYGFPVLGVDIDAPSIRVAQENVERNGVAHLVPLVCGDGYNTESVRINAPYDLIFANILARPLCDMAPKLAKNLAKGGVAILSGLLERQMQMVVATHRNHGLVLHKRILRDGWATLVMKKI